MNKLFDKQINIYLYDTIGGEPTDTIIIPETGIKPKIGINADFTTNQVVTKPQIRLTNFYPSKALNEYQYVKILAGYKDSTEWAGFEGQIWLAYQESPSPDGVTLISFETGVMTDIFNADIDIHIEKNDTLSSVFRLIINALSDNSGVTWDLENNLADDVIIPSGLDYIGSAKDLLADLKNTYGFSYMYEGSKLVVFKKNEGRSTIDHIPINYISSPPAQDAAGITFTAPWIPSLKPWMIIDIDPKYFKQSYGGTKVTMSSTLVCATMSVQFNTVDNQNTMTVLALNIEDIANT